MTFYKLSSKQKAVFKWCYGNDYKALICDGSVRSGKTVSMATSFILWAMSEFNGATFAICGKTVQSAERNVVTPLQGIVDITHYYNVKYTRSNHCLVVANSKVVNTFYIFGGKDESSYEPVQGITLSGALLDEVALMPRSFVEQVITRTLSVEGAKLWFNCNPASSEHWFYKEWVLKSTQRRALHLHFTMEDNPVLTEKRILYAESQFSGVFYERYIKGLWVLAEGLVYPMFKKEYILGNDYVPSPDALYYVSCDYGIKNPTAMGLWALEPDRAVRLKEYYYDGRANQPRTDEEHYQALDDLTQGFDIQAVFVDPSASSFIECIRRHEKFSVKKANNSVLDGIRNTTTLLSNGKIFICEQCKDIIKEFTLYCWDEHSVEDRPIKEHDHACDDMRYFVMGACRTTLLRGLAYETI